MLFDSHCHLDDPRFKDDYDEILERAAKAGVSRLVTIGCAQDIDSIPNALKLAQQHPTWISATAGVHPHDARVLDEDFYTALSEAAKDPLVVAVGETGLDYHYDHSPREAQQQAFRRHVAIAKDLKKPLVVHTRSAPEDTLRILKEEGARDVGGIIHCFSEDAAFAKSALELGFVSSFSGIVTFKNARAIQEAARAQPSDAILVETDAPYLAPQPKRGRRNEPAYVAYTADFIADLRNEPREAFGERCYLNTCRVFGLPEALPDSA